MPHSKVRVVGSGFTTFKWRNRNIAWLDGFTDSGQRPIVGHEAITPLGDKHPREIVTPRVLSEGTITATVRELWDEPVWQQMAGLENTDNIIEVFEQLARMNEISCEMIIKIPGTNRRRGKKYLNVVVTDIDDREQVQIGTLSFPRTLRMVYTHYRLT